MTNKEKIKTFSNNFLIPLDHLLRKLSPYIKDDELFVRLHYLFMMHKRLKLHNPQTYNEKVSWLKLHDIHPEYSKLVDKYESKIYVADKTEGTATLNAINYRRSNLDISKTVDGVGAPETDEFTYTLTIKDTAATDDLYFSIRNADGTNDTTQNIEGARVSGDNYIISKADFIKGVTFTFTLNNGDNVRFFNLTTRLMDSILTIRFTG